MELAILTVLLGGAGIAVWAGDLGASLRTLFSGTSVEEAGALHTKQAALSQIITFAVLADGEVTDGEADNLRYLFEESAHFTGDPDEAIEQLRELAKRVSRGEALENTVRVVASDLDRAWKEDAFRFVAVLALRGSGFGRAETSFRSAPMSDPDALLAIFARALDIDEATREAAIEGARRLHERHGG